MTCNEWNSCTELKGTSKHAALICAMMLSFQTTPLDSAMFYDAQCTASTYASLFNPLTKTPYPAYYAFKAFNELYKLGEEVEINTDDSALYALAAKGDGKGCLVIANPTDEDAPLTISSIGRITECYETADGRCEEKTALPAVVSRNSFLAVHFDI